MSAQRPRDAIEQAGRAAAVVPEDNFGGEEAVPGNRHRQQQHDAAEHPNTPRREQNTTVRLSTTGAGRTTCLADYDPDEIIVLDAHTSEAILGNKTGRAAPIGSNGVIPPAPALAQAEQDQPEALDYSSEGSQLSDYTDDTDSDNSDRLDLNDPDFNAQYPIEESHQCVEATLALHRAGPPVPPKEVQIKALTHPSKRNHWIYVVPITAVALQYSSFFVLPKLNIARVVLYNVTHHRYFEMFTFLSIFANCIFIATETPRVDEVDKPAYQFFTEYLFALIYTLEMIVRMIPLGLILHKGAYLRSLWNVLDVAVVAFAWATIGDPSFGNYTPFRLIRTLKCLKAFHISSVLNIVIYAFITSFAPIGLALVVLFMALLMFAMLGVQLWMGVFGQRCVHTVSGEVDMSHYCTNTGITDLADRTSNIYWGRGCSPGYECMRPVNQSLPEYGFLHFDNVATSLLAVFTISTFDGWGYLIADPSYDIMSMLCFFFFFFLILIAAYWIPFVCVALVIGKLREARLYHDRKVMRRFEEVKRDHFLSRSAKLRLRRGEQHKGRDAGQQQRLQEEHRRKRKARAARDADEARKAAFLSRHNMLPTKVAQQMSIEKQLQLRLVFMEYFGIVQQTVLEDEAALAPSAKEDGFIARRFNRTVQGCGKTVRGAQFFAGTNTLTSYTSRIALDKTYNASMVDTGLHNMNRGFEYRASITASKIQKRMKGLSPTNQGEDTSSAIENSEQNNNTHNNDRSSQGSRTSSRTGRRSSLKTGLHVRGGIRSSIVMPVPPSPSRQREVAEAQEQQPQQQKQHPDQPHPDADNKDANAILVQDPEGGTLREAKTCAERWDVIRNTVHAWTEGYPRVVSIYISRQMQQDVKERIPEAFQPTALRSLTRRLAFDSGELRTGVAKASGAFDDNADAEDSSTIEMTPLEVARRIRDHAPPTPFNWFVAFMVLVDVAFLGAMHRGVSDPVHLMCTGVGFICNTIFCSEIILRFIALGPYLFFYDAMNLFDSLVVIFAYIEFGLVGSTAVGTFRFLRLLRLFKLFPYSSTVRHLSRIMLKTIPYLVAVSTLLVIYLFMCTLIGMQFLYDKYDNTPTIPRSNFQNFLQALFSVFQTITRDDWVPLMYSSMGATSWGILFYFVVLVIIGNLIFLPLYLASFLLQFDEDEIGDGSKNRIGIVFVHNRAQYFSYLHTKQAKKELDGVDYLVDRPPQEVIHLTREMEYNTKAARRQRRQFEEEQRQMTANHQRLGDAPTVLQPINNENSVSPRSQRGEHDISQQTSRTQNNYTISSQTHNRFGETWRNLFGTARIGTASGIGTLTETQMKRLDWNVEMYKSPELAEAVLPPEGVHRDVAEVLFYDEDGVEMAAALPAPPGCPQRTPQELYEVQADLIRLRRTKQAVLLEVREYIDTQVHAGIEPTTATLDAVLGQLWGSGMMLRLTTVEAYAPSPLTGRASWDIILEELEVEQAVLDLQVGEEQVGRSQISIIAAHLERSGLANTLKQRQREASCWHRSLFIFRRSNPLRAFLLDIVESLWFEILTFVIICCACLILAIYTPRYGGTRKDVLDGFDNLFTVLFTIEMVIKIIAWGFVFMQGAYLRSGWNIIDFIVVIMSILSWALSPVEVRYIKAVRLVRILRLTRLFYTFSNLRVLSLTILRSLPAICVALLFIAANYLVWSVCSIYIWVSRLNVCNNPDIDNYINCTGTFKKNVTWYGSSSTSVVTEEKAEWVPLRRNYDNMGQALLTMTEVSTGEWWRDALNSAIDSTGKWFIGSRDFEEYKGLFFIAYIIVANFVMFRFLGGVVFYNYDVVRRQADGSLLMNQPQRQWCAAQRLLLRVRPSRALQHLNNKVSALFANFFCTNIYLLGMIVVILLNVLFICLIHYDMEKPYVDCTHATNIIFVTIYLLDMVLKWIAYAHRYFTSRWNIFDFVLNVLVVVDIILFETGNSKTDNQNRGLPLDFNLFRIIKLIQLMQYLRSVKSFRQIRIVLSTVWESFWGLLSVAFFGLVAIIMFGIIGLHAFAKVPSGLRIYEPRYPNFTDFLNSIQLLFRIAGLEDWDRVMRDTMVLAPGCNEGGWDNDHNCGSTVAPLFFIPFILITAYILVFLAIGVVAETYDAVHFLEGTILGAGQVRRFLRLWSRYDPDGDMYIPTDKLANLLEDLRPKLGILRTRNRHELLTRLRSLQIIDHCGIVYFTEVLVPIARQCTAIVFTPNQIKYMEEGWKREVAVLRGLPVTRYRDERCTADQHFVANYVAAVYKRRIARILVARMLQERHINGTQECLKRKVPPPQYGYNGKRFRGDLVDVNNAEALAALHQPQPVHAINCTPVPPYPANISSYTRRAVELYEARLQGRAPDDIPISEPTSDEEAVVRQTGASTGTTPGRNPLVSRCRAQQEVEETRRLGRMPTLKQLQDGGLVEPEDDHRRKPLFVETMERTKRLLRENPRRASAVVVRKLDEERREEEARNGSPPPENLDLPEDERLPPLRFDQYEYRTDLMMPEEITPFTKERARVKNEAIMYPPDYDPGQVGYYEYYDDDGEEGGERIVIDGSADGHTPRGKRGEEGPWDEAEVRRFPAKYNSALVAGRKMFGPEVPEAIHRDYRRTLRKEHNKQLREYLRMMKQRPIPVNANTEVPLGSDLRVWQEAAAATKPPEFHFNADMTTKAATVPEDPQQPLNVAGRTPPTSVRRRASENSPVQGAALSE